MGIKIKYRDPKPTDFSPDDIIINVNDGTLFYKSNREVYKLQGDNLSTLKVNEQDTKLATIPFFFYIPQAETTMYRYPPMYNGSNNPDSQYLSYKNAFICPYDGQIKKLILTRLGTDDNYDVTVTSFINKTQIIAGNITGDPMETFTKNLLKNVPVEFDFINSQFNKGNQINTAIIHGTTDSPVEYGSGTFTGILVLEYNI